MNFLAHYQLTQPGDEDDFRIGSLLPDIARRAEIALHQGKIRNLPDTAFLELIRGMELHWEADRQFHQAPLFDLGVGLWKVYLGKKFPGVERKFFLFHLAFEMWLDRLILKRYPDSAIHMYDDLTLAGKDNLTRFAQVHLGDEEGFLNQTFEQFVNRRFILDYSDSGRFAGIVTDIFSRVTKQEWNENWMDPVVDSLRELERFESDVLFIWEQFSGNFRRPPI